MQNELQNAYALSSEEHNEKQAAHRAAIAAVVAVGLFAVVEESAAYCPRTDAVLRNPHRALLAALPSYEEASQRMFAESPDYGECDGEVTVKVECLPELRPERPCVAAKTVYPQPVDEDDIPF
jgi:hypothetical protein